MKINGAPLLVLSFAVVSLAALAQSRPGGLPAASEKIRAQKLIETALLGHPEVTSLEISTFRDDVCKTIAASNPKDLNEKCDKDELGPLRTGKPLVEKERNGFDMTLPFHDASGKTIAVVGMDFKPRPGQTKDSVVAEGRQIVLEMEAQVPWKDKLFERLE